MSSNQDSGLPLPHLSRVLGRPGVTQLWGDRCSVNSEPGLWVLYQKPKLGSKQKHKGDILFFGHGISLIVQERILV